MSPMSSHKDMAMPLRGPGATRADALPEPAAQSRPSVTPPIAWEWKEHWWGQTGECAVADMTARIVDHDGDDTTWKISGPHGWLSEGRTAIGDHTETAREFVEAEIRRRLSYASGIVSREAIETRSGSTAKPQEPGPKGDAQ